MLLLADRRFAIDSSAIYQASATWEADLSTNGAAERLQGQRRGLLASDAPTLR